MTAENKQVIEKPSALYSMGINLFYWFLDVAAKTLVLFFFWNKGITQISHSIPQLTWITSFSILAIISLLVRLIGNSLADTVLLRGFVFYQQVQLTKQLVENAKRNIDSNDTE